MSVTVKHPFVSAVPDSADTSLVRPSNWNADHTIIGLGTAAELNAGVANGVATLDSGGKVPVSELPAAVLGALSYQGTWNASTNTPTLASGVGTKGYYYVVSVAGSTNLDGITDWLIGDWAVYNGTAWQKVDNTESVTSVNGQTGAVVLTTTNVAEGTNEYFTTARARASVSAGAGISYDSGTGVITNAAPDQTVVLTASTGISTSGTYPSFTVTNTAPDQTVALTGAGTTVVTGTYPNFTITSNDSTTGTVTSVAASAGTGISVSGSPITTSGTLTITNTAPDQTVVLTAGTGISTSGTYPNFTITNTAPSGGGDVVGPASATDNAVARYDSTTGKLIQNSLVIIGDTGSVTGVNALTAESLTVNNNATLGQSNTDTLDVNARITTDLEPNTNNAKDIGTSGRNWRDGFFGRNLDTVNLAYTGTLTGGTGVIAIGTNQIYKDSSGNVGIGTATPTVDYKLHVAGNIIAGGSLRVEGSNIRASGGGSAAAPSIQPGEDADTGMYWGGSNTISFSTGGTRRAEISDTGAVTTFANTSATYAFYATNANASPLGIRSTYSGAAPNGTGNAFYIATDTSNTKFVVRSNGGISNFQANDTNLSDRRDKKDFQLCGNYLEKLCQIPVQKFRYVNQAADDDGLSIGVTAQDVQAVFPELVMESDWSNGEEGSEPKMRLSIYQTDLQYVMMKCIQEQQVLITQLQADVATLKGN